MFYISPLSVDHSRTGGNPGIAQQEMLPWGSHSRAGPLIRIDCQFVTPAQAGVQLVLPGSGVNSTAGVAFGVQGSQLKSNRVPVD